MTELRELDEGLNAEIASLTERQGEEAACQQRREGDWRVGKERQKSLLEQKQRLAQEKEELEVQFQELSQRLCEAEEQRQKAEGEQNSVQEKLTAAEERLAQLLAEAEAGSELLEAAKSELIGVLEERAGFRNRFNSLEEEAEKLSLRLERTKGRLEEIAGEREELAAEEAELEGRRERLAAEKNKSIPLRMSTKNGAIKLHLSWLPWVPSWRQSGRSGSRLRRGTEPSLRWSATLKATIAASGIS